MVCGKQPNGPQEMGHKELGTSLAPAGYQHGAGPLASQISPVFSSFLVRSSQRGDTLPL